MQGIIAGGEGALLCAAERAEDRPEDGATELRRRRLAARDIVMGIAASGVTPFVLGALAYARRTGASTVFFTCNREAAERVDADIRIVPDVGPEVITGSTRLKAGTATKLVLNMITTAAMVRLGKVYGNLMVDLTPTCEKLNDRARRILMETTGQLTRRLRPDARRGRRSQDGHRDVKTGRLEGDGPSVALEERWRRQAGAGRQTLISYCARADFSPMVP